MSDPTSTTSLADLRQDYKLGELDEASVDADPVEQFRRWFDEASASQIVEPNAMIVSTVSADGAPSSRTVLLKGYGADGFRFYSNYDSQKGQDLAANDRIAVIFYWGELERQVRIEGTARRLDRARSLAYHQNRPRKSQISALASRQTQPMADRVELDAAFAETEREVGDGDVPLPDDWGGYLVVPHRFEFWQGRRSRRHDRVTYERSEGGWEVGRLAP